MELALGALWLPKIDSIKTFLFPVSGTKFWPTLCDYNHWSALVRVLMNFRRFVSETWVDSLQLRFPIFCDVHPQSDNYKRPISHSMEITLVNIRLSEDAKFVAAVTRKAYESLPISPLSWKVTEVFKTSFAFLSEARLLLENKLQSPCKKKNQSKKISLG